jgi:hypothetical protein
LILFYADQAKIRKQDIPYEKNSHNKIDKHPHIFPYRKETYSIIFETSDAKNFISKEEKSREKYGNLKKEKYFKRKST